MDQEEKIQDLREAFCRENQILTERANSCRKMILAGYGTVEHFRNSLRFRLVDRADCSDFQEGYHLYEKIFTLPEERESFEGFALALELNRDKALIRQFGPFKEMWLLVDTPEGKLIGGVNFSVFSMPSPVLMKYHFGATLHISYIFVEAEYRSLGVASYLLDKMEEIARQWLAEFYTDKGKIAFFCEQNAPELMTSAAYFTDCINARIDQCDRLLWWHRKGYSRLRFNYSQPALSEESEPCTTLTFNVREKSNHIFPVPLLAGHLNRFFTISVLKARKDNHSALDQVKQLERLPYICTESNESYYQNLRRIFYSPEVLVREPLKVLY